VQQPTEIEKLLGELEIAVDRVRSLYDQYFMGIEKLEPTVPRKDIDRRVHMLHKEQIRNTALRFRFQMILHRYNTFQSHWQRICREIENGTYKRHVLRADRRFGRTSSAPSAAAAQAGSKPPSDIERELAELDAEFAPPPVRRPSVESLDPFEPPILVRRQASKPDLTQPQASKADGATFPTPPPTSPGLGPAPARTQPGQPPPRRLVAEAPLMANAPAPPRAAGAPAANAPAPPPVASAVAGANAASPPRPGALPPRAVVPPTPPPRVAPIAPAAGAQSGTDKAPPRTDKAPSRKEDSLPEYRVRELYVEYVETKRRQNESTVALTYDALAQSLRDSSAKLRQKHGKPVDFVVAVRDGKAVLKPVLK
jgi:hypothetical protein